ncbi:hypothetical protein B0J17DRAFT_633549, partial [Rhizoctonia solani]
MIDSTLSTPMPPGGLRISPQQEPVVASPPEETLTPPGRSVRTPTASVRSRKDDPSMEDAPSVASRTLEGAASSRGSLEREAELRSHLHSRRTSREGSIYSETVRIEHKEIQAMLLDSSRQLADIELSKYLPYIPSTTMYVLRPDEASEFEFMPASAGLTSEVRINKQVNDYRKIFRRMGRIFYSLEMPAPEENRYPSRSCEVWAKHIFDLLDKVVTFRPTCRITALRIPAQEIHRWPEYGQLYIALTQLINRTVTQPGDINSLLPLPEWPASECLFHAHSFEVAAVCFRDQMERTIQKLYDIISVKVTDRVLSPVISTGEFSDVDPMQEDLKDRTMRLDPNSSLIIPKDLRAILPPPEHSPSTSKDSTPRTDSDHLEQALPVVTTAELVEDIIQMIGSPRETTNSQLPSLTTTPLGSPTEPPEPVREPEVRPRRV